MVKIEYLSDYPEYTQTVAKWLYNEFGRNIRPGLTPDKVLAKVQDTHKTKLPICLIALTDNKCVGTISIVINDLQCRTYIPWLASLYVDPAYRKNKIGALLVDRVKEIVKELGYSELYLRTEFAGDYYRARDWQYVEACLDDEYQLETNVFKFVL